MVMVYIISVKRCRMCDTQIAYNVRLIVVGVGVLCSDYVGKFDDNPPSTWSGSACWYNDNILGVVCAQMARPDNPYSQKSYPILGAGIFLTGIVILAIGLIFGFEFPKYVLRQGQLRVCITSPSSRGYEPWLHNRHRTKRNFVYIWNMTNVEDFVSRGHKPEFDKIGPYVYDEHEVKVDVRFKYGQVMYRPWTRQLFNGPLTTMYCGHNCSEDDRVMTINRGLLQQEVNVFPSELAFYLSLVPRLFLHSRDIVQKQWLSFDAWCGRRDTGFKREVLDDPRRGSAVSLAAFMGLYETLTDDRRIFRSAVLRRPEAWKTCEEYDRSDTILDKDHVMKCGLAYWMLRFSKVSPAAFNFVASTTNWTRLGGALSILFCSQDVKAGACFLDGPPNNLMRSYVEALLGYVTEYLPSMLRHEKFVLQLDEVAFNLVSDNSVRQFVTGYNPNEDDERRVRGVLDHQDTEHVTRKSSRRITLRTCLFNRSQTENLYYDEIDEFHSCNPKDTSCLNSSSTIIGGIQDYEIPTTRSLTPCRQPEPFARQAAFYIPEMWRSASFSDYGPAIDPDRHVRLQDFRITGDQNDIKGTIFTGDFTGHLSWVEMTKDQLENSGHTDDDDDHDDGDDDDDHAIIERLESVAKSNRILIEPISGYVWRRTANFQFFVGLKREFQLFDGATRVNRSHLIDVPFRSHALHVEIGPSEESLNHYESEVSGLLRVSCIGLIGLSMVGLLVVAFGICVTFSLIRKPSNRVAPQFYVNPNLPPLETSNEGFGGNTVILY